jgi:hypothetical protein
MKYEVQLRNGEAVIVEADFYQGIGGTLEFFRGKPQGFWDWLLGRNSPQKIASFPYKTYWLVLDYDSTEIVR